MSKILLNPLAEVLTTSGVQRVDNLLPDSILLNGDGQEINIKKTKSLEKTTSFDVVLKNGNILTLGEGTLVSTVDGVKPVEDISEEDYILHSFAQLKMPKGGKDVPWKDIIPIQSSKVRVPKVMTPSFALWLGIICSKGRYTESSGLVGVSLNDKKIEDIFDKLTEELFDIEPIHYFDKRTGFTLHYIISRNLVRFLKNMLGNTAILRKAPQSLLEGSQSEQISFIHGLTLDGYVEQGQFTVYGGIAKRLADFTSLILRNSGHAMYQQIRKSGQGNNVYYSKILASCENSIPIVALEKQKQKDINPGQFLVKVSKEILETKVPIQHPSYSALRNIRQRGQRTCYNGTLDQLNLDYPKHEYYVMVKEVSKEKKNLIELATDDDKGIIYHGSVLGKK